MNNYDNQKYGKRIENYQNYQKNPNKINFYHDNTYKKRDNSAILRRAINKRYKEDINKNNTKSNDLYNEEDDEYDSNNPYKNNDKYNNNEEDENFRNNNQYNFNNINNVYNSNYNSYNNFIYTDNSNYNSNINSNYSSSPNYNSNNNYSYYDEYSNSNSNSNNINNNIHYDKSLLNRINHKKNKNININMNMNLNNYYSTHISKDNIYDEFIIDYKSGINPNQNQTRNSLSRFNTQSHYVPNQNPSSMNNTNYERAMALNNNNYNRGIYKTSNYRSNNNIHNTINQGHIKNSPYGDKAIDYNIPYQKRKINNYTYNPKKIAMMNKSNNNFNNKYNKYTEKYYYRNQSSNASDDAFMESRQNNSNFKTVELSNNFDRSYGGLNDDYNNYDNDIGLGYKDIDSDPFQKTYNMRNNYMQEAQRRYLIRQNFINRINEFTNHFSKYCVLYYYKVVVKLFKYLKENKNKNKNKNKYNIKNPKKNIMNKNKKNLTIKNKPISENKSFSTNRTNYHKYLNKPAETEPKNNKIPYNKNKTNIIIERIKSSNESRSPESKEQTEMYRNLNELSKKFEVISNRRNRLSSNNSFRRNMNDLSFNSENKSIYRNSVEKNKEKWEKTISKERKRRKKILEKSKKKQEEKNKDKQLKSKLQDNKINKEQEEKKKLADLKLKNEELKVKIQQLKENNKSNSNSNSNNNSNNDKNVKNEEKSVNEFGGNNYNRNTISYLNREKIREKYKKKNLKNKTKDKNEMITIKNIISKDKALYIDIKYLNYIPMKDKNTKATNINKSYQICDNSNINLDAVKVHNANNKIVLDESKEKDNSLYKLSSIKEENKVEMDLSDDASQNSNENKNSKI